MAEERNDPHMDIDGLYQEDNFTDRRVGAIRRLTPVRPDASVDPTRPVLFVGQAEIAWSLRAGDVGQAQAEVLGVTLALLQRRLVVGFWHDVEHLVTALGRGQTWWAYGQLDELLKKQTFVVLAVRHGLGRRHEATCLVNLDLIVRVDHAAAEGDR